MRVLIVESNAELGALWQRHLLRHGRDAVLVTSQEAAVAVLMDGAVDVIVLDLVLPGGSAFAVADLAMYRMPQTAVIFVTSTTFFSDGSIFALIPNARAFVQTHTPPEDLDALVEHYGSAA